MNNLQKDFAEKAKNKENTTITTTSIAGREVLVITINKI